ncbi:MAG: methylenetetrahydrofolate reductase, partial [Stellaceae bacterium]
MTPLNESRTSASPVSTLQRRLDEGRFCVTAEVTPPLTADPADFIARALPLKGVTVAVNVTDGAGAKSHMASMAAAHFLVQNGIEPILQMTCRDRNRIALQSDLLGAVALG